MTQRTGGRITFQYFWSGSLLTIAQVFDGIRDGLADAGYGVTTAISGKIPQPLKLEGARYIVADLGTWRVVLLEVSDVLKASRLSERFSLSFWDGLILAAAQKEDAKVVWSEDFSHGQNYDGVTVRNPFVT